MITAIAAWLGRSALMQSPIGGFLRVVPRWVWLALLIGFIVWRAIAWHDGKIEAFGDERYQAGRNSRDDEVNKLRKQIDSGGQKMAGEMRNQNDAKLRDVTRAADDVRVLGPGKAICPGAPFVPSTAGGHEQADRPADASLDPVHHEERPVLVALPFAPTVDFSEAHDAYRIEALAWREWHQRFTDWWATMQQQGQAEKVKP